MYKPEGCKCFESKFWWGYTRMRLYLDGFVHGLNFL